MKRFLAFIITVLFLLALCGCTKTNPGEETHNHTHTEVPTTVKTTISEEITENVQSTDSPAAQNPQNTTESDNTTTPDTPIFSDTLKKGTTEGNLYTSATLGLTFEKPSAWAFAQDADLANYSGIFSDSFDDFAAAAENSPAVYDMYAKHKESGSVVSICYENLLITMGAPMSAKEYAAVIGNAITENPDSTITEESEITLGARTYSKLIIKTDSESENATRTYYLTQVGNYMATIIATMPEGSDINPDSMFR